MELSVNSFLQGGKYRIVRYINSGGFGCTYEAEHVLLGKRVAIKEFFVKDFCNRDEHTCQVTVGTESKKGLVKKLQKKFIDEARALSGLHHPGIVSVSDVFGENGTAYYVMDYIDGCTLSDLLRHEGPLSESRALGYIRQVCAALSYVHAHDRLHLDIKPGNIMIDQEGKTVLIDFGASKQYDECSGENTSTLMGRTPGYAPLEQLGNDVVKFLPATDIYAVGATLYKLLTGVTPLSATRLASGESLPPLPAQVSASTHKAVESAMCLNKMQRPQSIEEFLQLLDEPEKRNSNNVEEDEDTIFDVSIKESKLVKPKKIHSSENTSVSGNKFPTKWLVPVVVCLFVGLCVYVFWGRKSGSSGTPNDEFASVEEQTFSKTEDTSSVSPESSPCLFYVKTSPSGAEIMVDGQSYGKSPIEGVKIPVGNHDIRITLSGYESISEKINFSNHSIVLNKILKAKKSAGKATSIYTYKSGSINGHDYVDLGLSVKWATCNVGASYPEDYGNYYAWGEIKTKALYNSKTYTLNHDIFKKGDDFSGNPKYDVARTKWGNSWRMPTKNEANELLNKCTWKYIKSPTLAGYEVKGPNGNVIFLPMAGMNWRNGKIELRNEFSSYWTSTAGSSWTACVLHLRDSETIVYDGIQELGPWNDRENGMSVRPVSN